MEFTIEIVPEDKMVYITEDNASGVEYPYNNVNDIADIVKNYINNNGAI